MLNQRHLSARLKTMYKAPSEPATYILSTTISEDVNKFHSDPDLKILASHLRSQGNSNFSTAAVMRMVLVLVMLLIMVFVTVLVFVFWVIKIGKEV